MRPIENTLGYFINEKGEVFSTHRGGHPGFPPRRLKPCLEPHGYLTIRLNGGRKAYVHRLVLETFVGPCPPGFEACHNNGVRADCRLSNLRWDSRSGNQRDRERHGTRSQGGRWSRAKVTPEQVREIRRRYKPWQVTAVALAREYGLAVVSMRSLLEGRTWGHV
jgi:hypothetical protein